jgi:hypothetical protein
MWMQPLFLMRYTTTFHTWSGLDSYTYCLQSFKRGTEDLRLLGALSLDIHTKKKGHQSFYMQVRGSNLARPLEEQGQGVKISVSARAHAARWEAFAGAIQVVQQPQGLLAVLLSRVVVLHK